jgi:hypothetical protein
MSLFPPAPVRGKDLSIGIFIFKKFLFFPVLWMRTRMDSHSFLSAGSGSGSRRAKITHNSEKKYVLKFWMFSLEASFMEV